MNIDNKDASTDEKKHSMERIINELEDVFAAYAINDEEYIEIKKEICDFKFRVPLVGVFSSGKSSFVNALLGENLLPADITPETSFPTEIVYGNVKNFVACDLDRSISLEVSEENVIDNNWSKLLLEQNANKNNNDATEEINEEETKSNIRPNFLLKIKHSSDNIKKLEKIRLLDIPGIDSSHADHDRVISQNIKEAIAYIIVVSVDEGTIKNSLQMIIKELAANQVPCAVLITKTDKHENSKIDQVVFHINKEFVRLIGLEPVFIAPISVRKKQIDSAIEGIQTLDSLAGYTYQKKIISPFCIRLKEIYQFISNSLDYSQLELRDIESKIGEIDESMESSEKVVESAIEKFEIFIANNINAIVNIVLEEVKLSERNLVSLIVKKNDKAKMEIEDTIQTAVRIGMLFATEKIIEPAYRELCSEISGTLSHTRGQITVGESLSFDIVNDVGMSEISLSKTALWTGIGGLLLATVFPFVGIAVGVISLAAGLFFKNKEDKEGGDKKTAVAKKQVREFFATLQAQLEKNLPSILGNKVGEVKKILTQELQQKLKIMQKQVLDLKLHIEENSIDKYCATLKKQHEKTTYALSEMRRMFAPSKAVLAVPGENSLGIEINFESAGLHRELTPIRSSILLAPVFNKIFFIWIDTLDKNNSPVFRINFPSLKNFSSSGLFRGDVEIFYEKNKIQHKSLFSDRETKLIQNSLALIYVNQNKDELMELVSISRSLISNSLDGQGSAFHNTLNALHHEYDQIMREAFIAKVEDISSIRATTSLLDLLEKITQHLNTAVDQVNLLTNKKIKTRTIFGTANFFKELYGDLIKFNSAMNISLSFIAALEAKTGLSVFCSNLRTQDAENNSIHEKISALEGQALAFRTNVIAQSNAVNSLFNRKVTIDRRKKEMEILADEYFNKIRNNIEKIKILMSKGFSIDIQYFDGNSTDEI